MITWISLNLRGFSEDSLEQQSPSESPKLFENTPQTVEPTPKPQRSKSGSRRQPVQIQPTVIPFRTPTQPVLISEKPREDDTEKTHCYKA